MEFVGFMIMVMFYIMIFIGIPIMFFNVLSIPVVMGAIGVVWVTILSLMSYYGV